MTMRLLMQARAPSSLTRDSTSYGNRVEVSALCDAVGRFAFRDRRV
jgi:hypothetical protein